MASNSLTLPLLEGSKPSTSRLQDHVKRVQSTLSLASAAIASDEARPWLIATTLATILGVGFGLGFVFPDATLPTPYDTISSIAGWMYFTCWSLSFWPQIYENWKRKSVRGLSFDFEVYNLIGFSCYAMFNCALFYSTRLQATYEAKMGTSIPVQANDVFFSLHALGATLVTLLQIVIYDKGDQRVSEACKLVVALAVLTAGTNALLVAIAKHLCTCFTLLNWLYLLSYVKLLVTLLKYIPQIRFNYLRKSTEGWSIANCTLDLGGGTLSLAQQLGDAYIKNDMSFVTGAPVKFGLGFVSIVADLIFIVQHYILYPEPTRSKESLAVSGFTTPLTGTMTPQLLEDEKEGELEGGSVASSAV